MQLEWSGVTWNIRDGVGEPHNNIWNPKNVWVDSSGYLHLKLSKVKTGFFKHEWHAVEITATKPYKYGKFTFDVKGPIGSPDPNVCLGIFLYPKWGTVPVGTHEIDIVEISKWGIKNGTQYNIGLFDKNTPNHRQWQLQIDPKLTNASFNMTWKPGSVEWYSTVATDYYMDDDISDQPQELHLNLWVLHDRKPKKEVEYVITYMHIEE